MKLLAHGLGYQGSKHNASFTFNNSSHVRVLDLVCFNCQEGALEVTLAGETKIQSKGMEFISCYCKTCRQHVGTIHRKLK